MQITRNELAQLLATELDCSRIRDYCPNGLQVEGKATISKIVTGVTASQALLDQTVALGADAVIVHHGYFWKNEAPEVTGMKKRRLQTLLRHDINLFAYHLPLDVHPRLGNNAQLGALLGIEQIRPLPGPEPVGVVQTGTFQEPLTLAAVAGLLESRLGRPVLAHDAGCGEIKTVAWCTGGGQGYIDQAAAAGVDLFISGEVSEQTIHSANEQQIHFIAAGHHATERYGIRALGDWLANQTGVSVEFVDLYNPA